ERSAGRIDSADVRVDHDRQRVVVEAAVLALAESLASEIAGGVGDRAPDALHESGGVVRGYEAHDALARKHRPSELLQCGQAQRQPRRQRLRLDRQLLLVLLLLVVWLAGEDANVLEHEVT